MSLGIGCSWWEPFRPLLIEMDTVPFPATFDDDPNVEIKESQALEQIERLLKQGTYAGIFIEPLIQGAGGMRMCRPEFLRSLHSIVRQFGTLIIYDEVMTGFGRTGELFACLKAGTAPDILCLSKGLSGGCLPLAVTLATEAIYQTFYSDDASKMLLHGHSYTGNPLACATGLTSLDLLEQTPQRFRALEALHRRYLETWLIGHSRIESVRVCGTIVAMEITTDQSSGYFNTIGSLLRERFLELGFFIRPLGNTLYLMPPYCITNSELESIYKVIRSVLDDL